MKTSVKCRMRLISFNNKFQSGKKTQRSTNEYLLFFSKQNLSVFFI